LLRRVARSWEGPPAYRQISGRLVPEKRYEAAFQITQGQ
jgi:hypothetical protein